MNDLVINSVTLNDADRIVSQQATQDGDGVKISRIAGQHLHALLDPFLLIDEINSDDSKDYVGGFPPHPHRGFQTFTYMLDGSFHHKDSMGNSGKVSGGGVQWMSAASGVIHSEMPEPDGDKLHGFQLWINLPAVEKMNPPDYRDIQAQEIPAHQTSEGAQVKVLAGRVEVEGSHYEGALELEKSKGSVLAVELAANAGLSISVPENHNVNVLVFGGALDGLQRGKMAHFARRDDSYQLALASAREDTRFLVLLGEPIAEPVAQYGPFVMNTMGEVEQALRDYRDGSLVK